MSRRRPNARIYQSTLFSVRRCQEKDVLDQLVGPPLSSGRCRIVARAIGMPEDGIQPFTMLMMQLFHVTSHFLNTSSLIRGTISLWCPGDYSLVKLSSRMALSSSTSPQAFDHVRHWV